MPWKLQKHMVVPVPVSVPVQDDHDRGAVPVTADTSNGNGNGDGSARSHYGETQQGSTAEAVDAVDSGEPVEEELHYVYQRYCHVYKEGELEDLCSR